MATAPEPSYAEIKRAEVQATLDAQRWTLEQPEIMEVIYDRLAVLREKYPHSPR